MWKDILKIDPDIASKIKAAKEKKAQEIRAENKRIKDLRAKGQGQQKNINISNYNKERDDKKRIAERKRKNEYKRKWAETNREKYRAYGRLYHRLKRTPTKEELEEEIENPTRLSTLGPITGRNKIDDRWKEEVQNRPKNYNKIFEIVRWLKVQNKTVDRQNILEELVDLPTNEDNEAIEFILGE